MSEKKKGKASQLFRSIATIKIKLGRKDKGSGDNQQDTTGEPLSRVSSLPDLTDNASSHPPMGLVSFASDSNLRANLPIVIQHASTPKTDSKESSPMDGSPPLKGRSRSGSISGLVKKMYRQTVDPSLFRGEVVSARAASLQDFEDRKRRDSVTLLNGLNTDLPELGFGNKVESKSAMYMHMTSISNRAERGSISFASSPIIGTLHQHK